MRHELNLMSVKRTIAFRRIRPNQCMATCGPLQIGIKWRMMILQDIPGAKPIAIESKAEQCDDDDDADRRSLIQR